MTFIQARVEKLPFADNSFGLVYALGVMDYLDNPSDFLRTVQRVLKPGGLFIFTYPNSDSINRMLRTALKRLVGKSSPGVSAVPIRSADMDRIMADCGFQLFRRHFITYGNGLVSLPWSVALSRAGERFFDHVRIGRYFAWSCLCIARK